MMFLSEAITKKVKGGFSALYGLEVPEEELILQPTKKGFSGSHTVTLFGLAKGLGKSPVEVGEALGEWLRSEVDFIMGYQVVGGFLNLELSDRAWLEGLKESAVDRLELAAFSKRRVLMEFSSPNTNKPLHLGHLRNIFLAVAMGGILKGVGCKVKWVQIINDRGIHICKSMVGYLHFGEGKTPREEGIKGDHFVGKYYVAFEKGYRQEVHELVQQGMSEEEAQKKAPLMQEAEKMLRDWEKGDEEVVVLWKKMNGWVYEGLNATYDRLGVVFDKTYYESETYVLGKTIVQEGLDKGVFYQKGDGSVWIDLKEEGLGEKLLLRGDGTSVYITQDMGTADLRYDDFGFEESIYVVGNEQEYHFKVLFAVLKKLGRSYGGGMSHLSYGMVDLPDGKMKSREGKVVDADDLMRDMVTLAGERTQELGKVEGLSGEEVKKLGDIIGLGALKYFLLRVGVRKRILFNPEESVDFQGHTAPFVQYTYARICALLRGHDGFLAHYDHAIGEGSEKSGALQAVERDLLRVLVGFEGAVREAAVGYNPAVLVEYVYRLAKVYNRFYNEVPVLKEGVKERRERRLYLSYETGRRIKRGMGLLGIEVPKKM